MRPLDAGMLLEGRAPLADLVGVLLKAPDYRLVLDEGRVESIVTPSDLVKLPMRVLVFGAVAHLEHAMISALERLYASADAALASLDADNQQQIISLYERLERANLNPSLMEVASLRQKARALTFAGAFGEREQADADFDDIVSALRNPVMHAAAYVDDSLEALQALDRRLRAVAKRTADANSVGR